MNTQNLIVTPCEWHMDLTGKSRTAASYLMDNCLQVEIAKRPGSRFLLGVPINRSDLRLLPEF
jgi:hypothetical protein